MKTEEKMPSSAEKALKEIETQNLNVYESNLWEDVFFAYELDDQKQDQLDGAGVKYVFFADGSTLRFDASGKKYELSEEPEREMKK